MASLRLDTNPQGNPLQWQAFASTQIRKKILCSGSYSPRHKSTLIQDKICVRINDSRTATESTYRVYTVYTRAESTQTVYTNSLHTESTQTVYTQSTHSLHTRVPSGWHATDVSQATHAANVTCHIAMDSYSNVMKGLASSRFGTSLICAISQMLRVM